MKNHHRRTTALVLVSPGFEEESTIRCMTKIRKSGVATKLVGLTAGLLVGAHGLTVRCDVTLADLESQKGYQLIVLPGSAQGNRSFLADPRAIRLFDNTAKDGGWIAVMNRAETLFMQAGLFDMLGDNSVIFQSGQETDVFVEKLVNLVSK